MLRRQSRDTNRNIKRCGVLPIWKVKSNISSGGPSSERNICFCLTEGPTLETSDFIHSISAVHQPFYIYRYKKELLRVNKVLCKGRAYLHGTVYQDGTLRRTRHRTNTSPQGSYVVLHRLQFIKFTYALEFTFKPIIPSLRQSTHPYLCWEHSPATTVRH